MYDMIIQYSEIFWQMKQISQEITYYLGKNKLK